jgi:hypothetical protein
MLILDIKLALEQEKDCSDPSPIFIDYLEGLITKNFRYVMVDGQHRTNSIKEYVDGRSPYKAATILTLNNTDYNLNKPFKEYSVEPRRFFLEQPISVTFIVKASLPALKRLFVTTNDGVPVTSIEKNMAGNAPNIVDGIRDISDNEVYLPMWDKITVCKQTKRQHEELIATTLSFDKNREDVNMSPRELNDHFHTDHPGFSATSKTTMKTLSSNWNSVYKILWPNIKDASGKFPRGSVQNLYMLISLITDERKHTLADALLGDTVRYKINDYTSFGDWFCKTETELMADSNNWVTDKNGKPITRPVWSKRKNGLVEKPLRDPTGYYHSTTRESTREPKYVCITAMLEAFVEYVNSSDSIGVITQIATENINSNLRKDIATQNGWKVDGKEVSYATMMNGKLTHLDHTKPKSKGGSKLKPMEARKNLLKSDTFVE